MLKYFYKTFLISILCGSLLMLDMSYKAGAISFGITSSSAGTVGVAGISEKSSTSSSESVSTGGVDDQNLMSTLTMVAISVIASRLVAYGKITPDIAAAAAGGAAFIAGDILATKKLKEAKNKIETSIQRNKKGDITDEQRQSIMRLIEMYKASKEAAETKKNLQLAAAAAFAAAAVLAYMAATLETQLLATCTGALTAAQPAVTSAGAATCSAAGTCPGVPPATKCNIENAALLGAINAYTAMREVPSPTCTAMPTVFGKRATVSVSNTGLPAGCTMWGGLVASPVAACQGLFAGHLANEPSCLPPAILYATTAAAVLLMGITISTIVTIVVSISGPLAELVDTALYTPARRAVVWGVLAGLSFAASSSTSNVISQIEGDIQKLENLLQTINSQAYGVAGNNSINKPTTISKTVNNSGLNFKGATTNEYSLDENGYPLPCAAKDASGKCSSLAGTINSGTNISGLPDAVSSSLSDLGTMADGLSGASTVSGSTQNAINSLAAKANAIGAAMKNVKAGTQKFLIANKSKTNFDEQEKKLKDSMNKAFKDAMSKNKTNSKTLLASFGSGAAMGDISKATEDAAKLLGDKMPKGLGEFKMPAVPAAEIPAMPNYAQGSDSHPAGDELAKMENSDEANKSGVTMDDYEIKTDITRDSKESIFEVISRRYKKSGYPRLFKRLAE